MAIQFSTTVQNNQLDQVEVTTGASALLELRSGAPPANCAAADTGTLLCSLALPADYYSAAASAQKVLLGSWTGTGAAGAGGGTNAAHFRLKNNAGSTTHMQGTAGAQVVIATSSLTAANGNVLNFASTTGVVVGQNVTGTGIPTGATVVALTGTTVTLSATSTAGVANAASITFKPDLVLDNPNIATGQTVTIASLTLLAANG